MFKRAIPFVLCTFIVFGCGKKVDKSESAIVVNGQSISRVKVNQAAEFLHQSIIRAFPKRALESIQPELYKAAAYQLVSNIVMLNEATKRKVTVSDEKIDSSFQLIKKNFPDEAAFQREMTMAGQTAESMKKQISETMTLDMFLKELLKNVDSITDADCQGFYEKNSEKFLSQPRIRASQILFPIDSSHSDVKKKQIEKDVTTVLQMTKTVKSLDEIVKKVAKSGVIGGDIGWFQKGDLKPILEDTLSKMKVGDISGVIVTDIGSVILQKTGEEPGAVMPYEKAKDQVRFMLDMKKKNEFVKATVDSLLKKTKITYNDTSLKPLSDEEMDNLFKK